ncbi:MAG: hypothetical protein AB1454_03340 [Candidatus Auribacterota bacterium]|jgi:hypothetical protein|uniref:Uncharacterized protein n=1 Tax=Candidatus Auribacter fodinae TaxID=2093366 RepID=A0A3A4R2H7_9BACT|nr:MAG: hypothetical protein C4541_11055 [Candidatus Auribacter fodinae]
MVTFRRVLKPVVGGVCCVCLSASLFLSGCQWQTFPKSEIEQRVIDVVEKEYGYRIRARIRGKTLGLYFPVTQIFGHDMSFTESFQDKLQDIFLVAARATLSTDADLDFFITQYSDEFKGIEISMIRSVEDTKRLLLSNISRNDYAERTVIEYKYNPNKTAEKAVRALFKDIPEKRSSAASTFLPGGSFADSFFFAYLMESELKSAISYSILSLNTKRIDTEKVLVYVKFREQYQPKSGYENYAFMFPSPSTLECMFEVTVIKGIVPLITNIYSYQEVRGGVIVRPPMPEPFSANADITLWDEEFYFDEVTLENFIIKQIASRLNRKLSEAANPEFEPREGDTEFLSGPQDVVVVEAEFVSDVNQVLQIGNFFQMTFRFREDITRIALSDEFNELVLKYFTRTIKKYSFKTYNALVFIDGDGKLIKKYDKAEIDAMKFDTASWKSFFSVKPDQY